MRNRYWTMYHRHKHFYYYYEEYQSRCSRTAKAVKVFLGLTSAGSIAAMLLSDRFPVLWAVLLAISQLVSLLEDNFGYSTAASALNFFVPDLDGILIDMEHDWDRINVEGLSDAQIMELVHRRENEVRALYQKYLTGLSIPGNNKHCKEVADSQRDLFFKNYEIELNERGPAPDEPAADTSPAPAPTV